MKFFKWIYSLLFGKKSEEGSVYCGERHLKYKWTKTMEDDLKRMYDLEK